MEGQKGTACVGKHSCSSLVQRCMLAVLTKAGELFEPRSLTDLGKQQDSISKSGGRG